MNASIVAVCLSVQCAASAPSMPQIFRAIKIQETGFSSGTNAVGDTSCPNGPSIGPYQIQYKYWKDSGVRGSWKQCTDRIYAERVMLAYWTRYCPVALHNRNAEVLARVHNGGPRGHKSQSTLKYWNGVRKNLEGIQSGRIK